MKVLELTYDELVAIYKFFRIPKEVGGIEYDKEVMRKIFVGMLVLGEKAKKPGFDRNTTWPINGISEDDYWRLTRQADIIDFQRGSAYCGYSLIAKVQRELVGDELPNLWSDEDVEAIGKEVIAELNDSFVKKTEVK